MAGWQTKKEIPGKFCTGTQKNIILGCFTMDSWELLLIKICKHWRLGFVWFCFPPSWICSQCCLSKGLTSSTANVFMSWDSHISEIHAPKSQMNSGATMARKECTHTTLTVRGSQLLSRGTSAHQPEPLVTLTLHSRKWDTCSLRLSFPTNYSS